MKKFNPHFAILILFSLLVACSATRSGRRNAAKPVFAVMPVIRDTLPKTPLPAPRKPLTPEQIQAYLRPIYRSNFDEFFAPEFQRLRGIIESQAKTTDAQSKVIMDLSDLISSTRTRAIRMNDSTRMIISAYQRENLLLRRAAVDKDQQQTESNKKQIAGTNRLVKFLMIAMLIIVFLVITGYVLGYFLYRSVKRKLKSINYV
jgi:regulator of extracellular matrix RemA (YlzA/DUF370 family)